MEYQIGQRVIIIDDGLTHIKSDKHETEKMNIHNYLYNNKINLEGQTGIIVGLEIDDKYDDICYGVQLENMNGSIIISDEGVIPIPKDERYNKKYSDNEIEVMFKETQEGKRAYDSAKMGPEDEGSFYIYQLRLFVEGFRQREKLLEITGEE